MEEKSLATVQHEIEEIEKDVGELTKIAIEDRISMQEIRRLQQDVHHQMLGNTKNSLGHQGRLYDIIGRTIVSRRFVNKVVSFMSKYDDQKEVGLLLLECTELVYSGYIKGKNQKQH